MRLRPLRTLQRDRRALVPRDPGLRLQRDAGEERHAVFLADAVAAGVAEDGRALAAVGTHEPAHVLHDAENGHVETLEHAERLAHVEKRHVLRRRHHHHAAQRQDLREGELRVAGAGRHVEDEVVERAPHHVAQHLLDERVDHRTAPDQRFFLLHEEPDRHHLDPVGLDRDDAVLEHAWAAARAEHHRNIRAVHVGVDDPDGGAGGA